MIFLQLFKYTLVGGSAFLVDFLSLYLLTEYFGFHYLASATIAFLLGLIFNYLLSIKWVFTERTLDSKLMEFGVFAVIGLIGLGANDLFIWLFTEKFQLYYLVSKIISAVLVYLWNFFARKLILFR